MTKHGEGRRVVPIRIGANGLAWIDTEAKRRGLNRSEMIRLMLAYAQQKMPKGWRP